MPPVTRRTRKAGRKSKNKTGRVNFRYRKGNNRVRQSRGRRSNGNTIALSTLSRKSEKLSISFREFLEFNDMGGDNGSTPSLIRINLNNPVIGGDNPQGADTIVTVLTNLKPGSTDPSVVHHSYNNKRNLADRLAEYFQIYRTCIVTSAEVTCVVTPKLNQLNGMTHQRRSIVPYLTNRGINNPVAGGPDHYLYQQNPNAMSQVEVWAVRQQNQGQLTNAVTGTPPLETLKQGIPNMRMTRLNILPNSSKGVTYKMKYTPRSQYGISDWRDNKKILSVFKAALANPDQKEAFMYVGIAGRHRGLDPAAADTDVGLPHFNVEVKIKYNLDFSERFNIDGNNEPTPHVDEL